MAGDLSKYVGVLCLINTAYFNYATSTPASASPLPYPATFRFPAHIHHINLIKGGPITRTLTHVIKTLLGYATIASRAKIMLEPKDGYILSLDAVNRLHCDDKWTADMLEELDCGCSVQWWNVLVVIHLCIAVVCNIFCNLTCILLHEADQQMHSSKLFLIYYLLPTCFGRCCDHRQGTFTRILIKYNNCHIA